MGISKTSEHIQIKIKMPNPSQEPPRPSNASNEDLNNIDVLCTFKINTESQNLDYRCSKDRWPYPNQDQDAEPQSGTSSFLKSPKWAPKGHGCLYLQNHLEHGWSKDQWPYPNKNQDAKPHSGTSTLLQCINQHSNDMFKVNSLWQQCHDLQEI